MLETKLQERDTRNSWSIVYPGQLTRASRVELRKSTARYCQSSKRWNTADFLDAIDHIKVKLIHSGQKHGRKGGTMIRITSPNNVISGGYFDVVTQLQAP